MPWVPKGPSACTEIEADSQLQQPDTQDGRVLLRHYAAAKLQDLFPENSNQAPDLEKIATVAMLEELQNKIFTFIPANSRSGGAFSTAARTVTCEIALPSSCNEPGPRQPECGLLQLVPGGTRCDSSSSSV
jgi:hypothetical protein